MFSFDRMTISLRDIAVSLKGPVERRLFSEYGAVFLTRATPPPVIIFNGPDDVERFQSSLEVSRAVLGDHDIELQSIAMEALLGAATRIADGGGTLSARASDSGRRSYDDTVRLWTRNVTRGLEHWQQAGRLTAEQAEAVNRLPPVEQVGVILDMEEAEQIYFGTFFNRSILYSVAAPGASQHLSMLAFDVAEFEEEMVERELGRFGWFRTVVNDFPHFTYLGCGADRLTGLGLTAAVHTYKDREYVFWVPDL